MVVFWLIRKYSCFLQIYNEEIGAKCHEFHNLSKSEKKIWLEANHTLRLLKLCNKK